MKKNQISNHFIVIGSGPLKINCRQSGAFTSLVYRSTCGTFLLLAICMSRFLFTMWGLGTTSSKTIHCLHWITSWSYCSYMPLKTFIMSANKQALLKSHFNWHLKQFILCLLGLALKNYDMFVNVVELALSC